jgi:hypothetical protein
MQQVNLSIGEVYYITCIMEPRLNQKYNTCAKNIYDKFSSILKAYSENTTIDFEKEYESIWIQ